MLYYNQELLTGSHIFSRNWWNGLLEPSMYVADGFNDFLANKEKIITTPRWKCPFQNRQLKGSAFIMFGSCTYEQIITKSQYNLMLDELIKEIDTIFNQRVQTSPSQQLKRSINKKKIRQIQKQFFKEFQKYLADARIYDATGELLVISKVNVPDGSYHQSALVTYYPHLNAVFLEDLIDSRDFNPQRLQSISDFFQKLCPISQPV